MHILVSPFRKWSLCNRRYVTVLHFVRRGVLAFDSAAWACRRWFSLHCRTMDDGTGDTECSEKGRRTEAAPSTPAKGRTEQPGRRPFRGVAQGCFCTRVFAQVGSFEGSSYLTQRVDQYVLVWPSSGLVHCGIGFHTGCKAFLCSWLTGPGTPVSLRMRRAGRQAPPQRNSPGTAAHQMTALLETRFTGALLVLAERKLDGAAQLGAGPAGRSEQGYRNGTQQAHGLAKWAISCYSFLEAPPGADQPRGHICPPTARGRSSGLVAIFGGFLAAGARFRAGLGEIGS